MPKVSEPEKLHGSSKWNDSIYIEAYRMSLRNCTEKEIYHKFKVSKMCWHAWKNTRPVLQEAVDLGQEDYRLENEGKTALSEYVFNRLKPEYQILWNRIESLDRIPNGFVQIEVLLSEAGETAQKHLFFNAMAKYHFNATEACRILNIPRKTYENWKIKDKEFMTMILDDMQEIKKDWMESKLYQSIEDGNPASIKLGLEAIAPDRGYSKSSGISVTTNVNVQNDSNIDLDKLPFHIKIQIIEWKEQEDKKLLEQNQQYSSLPAPILVEGSVV